MPEFGRCGGFYFAVAVRHSQLHVGETLDRGDDAQEKVHGSETNPAVRAQPQYTLALPTELPGHPKTIHLLLTHSVSPHHSLTCHLLCVCRIFAAHSLNTLS